jgi:tetratricopeptide (TPR) repeat protein
VLQGLERQLGEDPVATLGLILSATEAPAGDEALRDRRLETLRNEVGLLQMELDALQSPVLAPDGAVQDFLGTRTPLEPAGPPGAGITTGLDDSLRALLSEAPSSRLLPVPAAPEPARTKGQDGSEPPVDVGVYSADPLRQGIACYRAGRYAEAYELLAPIPDANALYWQARALERLERLDEAVTVMERAVAKGVEGFELRRAQTDLEFLRWKRDFLADLPKASKPPEAPR